MTGCFHIVVAMKPVEDGFAENAVLHGVAGLNVDECRIGMGEGGDKPEYQPNMLNAVYGSGMGGGDWKNINGRWPANVILDDSDAVKEGFPETTSGKLQPHHATGNNPWVESSRPPFTREWGGDSGSAARFFKQIAEFQPEEKE